MAHDSKFRHRPRWLRAAPRLLPFVLRSKQDDSAAVAASQKCHFLHQSPEPSVSASDETFSAPRLPTACELNRQRHFLEMTWPRKEAHVSAAADTSSPSHRANGVPVRRSIMQQALDELGRRWWRRSSMPHLSRRATCPPVADQLAVAGAAIASTIQLPAVGQVRNFKCAHKGSFLCPSRSQRLTSQ